jgi:hypothetical protein
MMDPPLPPLTCTSPYEADYEERVVENGVEEVRASHLWVDRGGRVRIDGTLGPLRFSWLMDLRAETSVMLDRETGKPVTFTESEESTPSCASEPLATPLAHTDRDLGERVIEGLTARGRSTTIGSETSEVWTVREIDQPAIFVHVTRPGFEETQRLFNIRFGEPDPALFAPLDREGG